MREVGIPNAEYITMGDFEDKVSDIPYYNLTEQSGLESQHSGATTEDWKEYAELAKDGISEIIESYIKEKS